MSFKIVIATKGLEKLPERIKRFRVGIIAKVGQMLTLSGEHVVGESREHYLSGPRPDRLGRVSGDLARSVTYRVQGSKVIIGTNLAYARIHELGGTIKPVKAKRLVFRLAGGEFRSAKEVKIPARPFLRTALGDSRPMVKSIIQRLTDQAKKEAFA